jgi:4-hydroxyacetophenone monooxygenase
MLRDNGVWAAALQQDNVEVVSDAIAAVTPEGVRTVDGVGREVDVIVYCTGFVATDYLSGVEVVGRDGVELHRWWAGEPRALLGVTVPHFPNLFCLYGPNTNLVVNGSTVMFSECAVHYVLECVRTILSGGHAAMECEPGALDRYQAVVDSANERMAWGVHGVTNWYKSESGRVSQNWPLSTLEYWRRTRAPEAGDYRFD